jgi:hypothetical protein
MLNASTLVQPCKQLVKSTDKLSRRQLDYEGLPNLYHRPTCRVGIAPVDVEIGGAALLALSL